MFVTIFLQKFIKIRNQTEPKNQKDLKIKTVTVLETNSFFWSQQISHSVIHNDIYFSGVQHCIVFDQPLMHGSCQWAANMHAARKICLLRHHAMTSCVLQHKKGVRSTSAMGIFQQFTDHTASPRIIGQPGTISLCRPNTGIEAYTPPAHQTLYPIHTVPTVPAYVLTAHQHSTTVSDKQHW